MPDGADGVAASRKAALRRRMLAARRSLLPAQREAYSERITAYALALPEVREARCVMLYAAMTDEVQTKRLLSSLLSMGKQAALPFIAGERSMHAVLVPSPDVLERGAYGILTVRAAARVHLPAERIDCALVPGAAFAPDGARLGMGGGYYDTFLPSARRAVRVGLAFACQITADIPRSAHDCDMDWVVTEEGAFRTRRNRSRTAV